MRNPVRSGLFQNRPCVIAFAHELVAFDGKPFTGVARTVYAEPFLFPFASTEGCFGIQFVCHRHNKMLLLSEWKRFQRPEYACLVDNLQLLGHNLIVPFQILNRIPSPRFWPSSKLPETMSARKTRIMDALP